MKLIFVALILCLAVSESWQQDNSKKVKPNPECEWCSSDKTSSSVDCVCSETEKTFKSIYCGPACDAQAYCCKDKKCPTCGSGQTPSSNSNCVCDNSVPPIRVKYACGPACDALGYCCEPTKTTNNPRIKCVPV